MNREIFFLSKLREDALKILEKGLSAVQTKEIIKKEVKFDPDSKLLTVTGNQINLTDYKNVYFVAIGKCAKDSAEEVERILGDAITDGVVLDISEGKSQRLRMRKGTHPLPSEANMSATEEIISMLQGADEKDLVMIVISGGGSALLCSPYEMDCETLSRVTKALMSKGATIEEMNTVRKHLSRVQGGQLAKIAYPTRVIGLVFSDVIGDDLSTIASGPLTKDLSTVKMAEEVLEKYGILEECSLPECKLMETPKEDKYFEKIETKVIVSSKDAAIAMRNEAESLGYSAEIKDLELRGEARTVGKQIAKSDMGEKSAHIFSGETTVTVLNPEGKGGRNQELVLGALLEDPKNKLIISFASDGRDNSDTAGAIADRVSFKEMNRKNVDPKKFLDENNSEIFWKEINNAIITGPTEINIADLVLVLSE